LNVKNGGSFLDIGCCFAQDIRKLVHDGAPADSLWGAELVPDFIDLGYELFNDKTSLGANFMVANIFDADGPLSQLKNSILFMSDYSCTFLTRPVRRKLAKLLSVCSKAKTVFWY
jgi:hypothetical protein